MTPADAERLIAIYEAARAAGERDDPDAVERLLAEAEALLATPCPAGAEAALLERLPAVDAARRAALAACEAARLRLLAAAAAELRAGAQGARAYIAADDRPEPRFIDQDR